MEMYRAVHHSLLIIMYRMKMIKRLLSLDICVILQYMVEGHSGIYMRASALQTCCSMRVVYQAYTTNMIVFQMLRNSRRILQCIRLAEVFRQIRLCLSKITTNISKLIQNIQFFVLQLRLPRVWHSDAFIQIQDSYQYLAKRLSKVDMTKLYSP